MSNAEQSLRTALRDRVEQGHYARKQILSRNAIIAWSHGSRMLMARRLVAPYAGRRLLDYGCGDGTFVAQVSDMFPDAIGVDPELHQIEDCRRRFSAVTSLNFSTITELSGPAHDGRYRVITCMEVLEHCIDSDVELVFTDLSRLLAPSGAVIISVPIEIGPSLAGKQMMRMVAGWRGLGDYRYRERYRPSELLRMMFATKRSRIRREPHPVAGGSAYLHKGFNWRRLRTLIRTRFDLKETRFSPLDGLGGWFSSQAWFVCSLPKSPSRRDTSVGIHDQLEITRKTV
jgi:2-polyprenyl-3-methyl-5-hydroxy-6-metoxy-1,4-benzoquinol methylase